MRRLREGGPTGSTGTGTGAGTGAGTGPVTKEFLWRVIGTCTTTLVDRSTCYFQRSVRGGAYARVCARGRDGPRHDAWLLAGRAAGRQRRLEASASMRVRVHAQRFESARGRQRAGTEAAGAAAAAAAAAAAQADGGGVSATEFGRGGLSATTAAGSSSAGVCERERTLMPIGKAHPPRQSLQSAASGTGAQTDGPMVSGSCALGASAVRHACALSLLALTAGLSARSRSWTPRDPMVST